MDVKRSELLQAQCFEGNTRQGSHAADVGIVRRACEGQQSALNVLGERMECIRSFLEVRNRRLGAPFPEHDIDDLSQEAAGIVLEKLLEFRGEAAFETWCCSISHGIWRNAIRRSSREALLPVDGLRWLPTDPAGDGGAEAEAIGDALDRLSPLESEVVAARVFAGETFHEFALRTGCSFAAVRSRYYRAIDHLRLLLSPER